jgi:hypothetical protein
MTNESHQNSDRDDELMIEVTPVDRDQIRRFTHEDQFNELSVRLLVETTSYVCVAACLVGQRGSWDREHAAIGGNMVRLYKLLHGVLDQVSQKRGELSFIFVRLIYEALINIRFLISNFSPELVASYVNVSLKHEGRLHDLITRNIVARGGVVEHIEERMLNSIERTARSSGVKLEDIDRNGPNFWGDKNTYQKAKAVGLDHAYLAAIGAGSNSIHGNWQEIAGNHLEWDETNGQFKPNTEWSYPRPQVSLSLGGP